LELFFFITNEDPEKRPSAREILKILDEAEVSLLSILILYYLYPQPRKSAGARQMAK